MCCERPSSETGFFPEDRAGKEVIARLTGLVGESRWEEARALLEEAKVRWPVSSCFWLFSAFAYIEAGDTSAALAELAVALGLTPDFAALFKHLARIVRAQGSETTADAIMGVGWSKVIVDPLHDEASLRAAFYDDDPKR